jgi:hypothetical protein
VPKGLLGLIVRRLDPRRDQEAKGMIRLSGAKTIGECLSL